MAMPLHRITELILKHHRGTLSPEEQVELEQWQAGSERRKRLVRELKDEEWLRPQLEHQDLYSERRVWEKFKQMVPEVLSDGREAEPSQARGPHASRIELRWAAAVILMIVAGGAYYFTSIMKHEKPIRASLPYKGDVQPGHSGAVLHLSNGRAVVLDSAQNGTVATQGTIQAVKTGGELKYIGTSSEVLYNTITTNRGRQWQLTLPDGTKVWLNAASSIHYPLTFTGTTREVEITGEAYFEVQADASQPFRVIVNGKQEVEVLGTSFNINAYDDENRVKTTLLEGSVRVSARTSPIVGVNTNNSKLSVVLIPGQQAELVVGENTNNGDRSITIEKKANIDQALAWKNGLFSFDKADIYTVMRQLSRWYNVDIKFEGEPANTPFQGEIGRSLTLAQVLKGLEQIHVHFRIEEDKRIVILP
jgi:transmembrane sensor